MDHAARGKKALAESKYQQAVDDFTEALKASPTSPDYLIQRATAYHRAKNYGAALADASNAVLNAQKRARREFIIEAQFRRGCALFSMERYGDAEFVFEIVKRMDAKHKMVPVWMQKVKMATDKLGEEDEKRKCNVKETPDPDEGAGAELTAEPANGTASANGATNTTTPQPEATPAQPQQTPADKIRHEYYQNSETIYFSLFAKGVPQDKTQIDIQERSLSISFPLITGSSFELTLDPLYGPVIPERSSSKFLPSRIEIILAKADPGLQWKAMESSEPATISKDSAAADATDDGDDEVKRAVLTDSKPSGPAYPTSAKSGPKDWDKVVRDVRKAENSGKEGARDDDDDDYGGDEANHFFKKLYKDASPEVQRAMMKSYTESNGTALSTNWEEVSKGPVETVPPDGMEAKTWDK